MFPDSKNVFFVWFLLRPNFSTKTSGLPDFYRVNLDVIGFSSNSRFGIFRPHTAMVCTWFPPCISFLTQNSLKTTWLAQLQQTAKWQSVSWGSHCFNFKSGLFCLLFCTVMVLWGLQACLIILVCKSVTLWSRSGYNISCERGLKYLSYDLKFPNII